MSNDEFDAAVQAALARAQANADAAWAAVMAAPIGEERHAASSAYENARREALIASNLQQSEWERVARTANGAIALDALMNPCPHNGGAHRFISIGSTTGQFSAATLYCQDCEAGVSIHMQEAVVALLQVAVNRGLLASMPQLLPTPAETGNEKEASK